MSGQPRLEDLLHRVDIVDDGDERVVEAWDYRRGERRELKRWSA